jgi:hypothetical protein
MVMRLLLRQPIHANILHSCKIMRDATPKSFVILDGESELALADGGIINEYFAELGRGTSTYVRVDFKLIDSQ